ncbi:MAG TPA: hypothetical protein VNT57_01150 [Desulfobacteria bacterium]|nr:hypothetical protein [Desulfobacteria bacterium]
METDTKSDGVYYGILAGAAGSVVQNIFTRPLVWFHIIDAGVLEHAKMILLGQNAGGFLSSLIGWLGNVVYAGLWGGLFAILITKYPGHKYLKGTGLGLTAWMIVMFTVTALKKNTGGHEEALHALFLLIGAALFGITTTWVYGKLTKKIEQRT